MLDRGAGDLADWTEIFLNTGMQVLFQDRVHCGHRLGVFSVLHIGMALTLMYWRGVGVQYWLALLHPEIAVMTGIKLGSNLTAHGSANDGLGYGAEESRLALRAGEEYPNCASAEILRLIQQEPRGSCSFL